MAKCRGSLFSVAASVALASGLMPFGPLLAKPMPPADATLILNYLAVCLVDKYEAKTMLLLGSAPGSDAERAAINLLLPKSGSYCIRYAKNIRLKFFVLRGAIAERFIRRDFNQPDFPSDGEMNVSQMNLLDNNANLAAIARCAVTYRPALVRSLLATREHSVEEKAKIIELYKETALCRPKAKISMSREEFRATFSQAQLTWARANLKPAKTSMLVDA